ncbi:DUF3137 domain-containing protein [Sulfurimonas sp. HSL-3221]|uniref:DUF3137 domain-containing protein n=1 Tax=Sulfurimonadaceae TaxID=2771471 RepID=UPI001E55EB0B|nr:DUF3137 domain-containing protein [Sulfurimonas sp. HSL-3221]UFS63578.1 DUF3137 domain-containing protein [Sulfurimonas sp. HSL-3221]
MKTLAELEQVFELQIQPHIPPERTIPLNGTLKAVLFTSLFAVTGVLLLAGMPKIAVLVLLFFALIYSILATRRKPGRRRRTLKSFQRLAVAPLLRAIDPALKYNPYGGIAYRDILASKLADDFPAKTYEANNLLTYDNDGLPVRMSHVMLEHHEAGEKVPVLGGLFGMTAARRPVEGTTIVSFDLAEKHLGFLGSGLQPKAMYRGLERIRLDSSGFEKEYVVHGSDPIEANFLLSHTVMEKLEELIREYRVFPRIAFVGDTIYIAVLNGGFFQPFSWTFNDLKQSINALNFAREAIKAIHHHHRL